jgi:hypothetical protein
VKKTISMFLFLAVVWATGCDPGFTVRQVNADRHQHLAVPTRPQLRVEVSNFHALVGSGFYTPKITITNVSESPVTVTGIDLVTGLGTYPLSLRQSDMSPKTMQSGVTREIGSWFELTQGLQVTFKKPAELRVHYAIGNDTGTATAMLRGKVQATNKP